MHAFSDPRMRIGRGYRKPDRAQWRQIGQVVDDPAPMRMVYEPGNPMADAKGYVQMPNVDVVSEMVNTISASRSYQANVEVLNTTKSLMMKTLTLGQ